MARALELVVILGFLFLLSLVAGSDVRKVFNPSTGSTASVEYSPEGVPFITASNEEDLFFTQGLIVAENRLWQIEVIRRWGLGTLAEIFPNALAIDKESRRMQWRQVCEENIRLTPQIYLDRIRYYIDGVNSFLAAVKVDPSLLPPEFTNYDAPFPNEVTIIDTFIMVKVLATGLSQNANSELRNQQMLDILGSARFNEYFAKDPKLPYVVPPYLHSNYSRAGSDVPVGTASVYEASSLPKEFRDQTSGCGYPTDEFVMPFGGKTLTNEEGELAKFLRTFHPEEFTRASNNWAVSGKHTESGLPIVANDPHLTYLAPSIWIVVGLHLDTPDSDWNHVVGATLILAPGVGIGRNEHVAWGYTMVQADNQDLYVMQNLPGDRTYKYNGTVMNYEITWEYIQVKGAAPYNITLYRSIYGPVIPNDDGIFYSLHWTAQYPEEPSVQAIMDQCNARTIEEYVQAASKWWSLCFNAVYGDTIGNIGYHASGAIPQRQPGDSGRFPTVGDGSMDWQYIAPFDELPNFVNPEEGYIVTANNPTAPQNEEVFNVVGTFAMGFRAQRIIDMLEDRLHSANPKVDVAYMSSIQGSVVNLEFSYLYSTIQHLILSDADDLDWQQKLLDWDGNELISSKEATVFDEFAACLYQVTIPEVGFGWDDPYLIAKIFNNATASGVGDDLSCGLWNQTCIEYASSCFSSTVDKYPIRVPEWGSLPHYAVAVHILPVPVNENLYAAVGGSEYTPNAAHSLGPRGPVLAGPSLRFIADMSGTIPNQMVLPGGESGVPGSPHYADQLPYWANIQTLDMDWSQFSE